MSILRSDPVRSSIRPCLIVKSRILGRLAAAAAFTILLVFFLVVTRRFSAETPPDLEIREILLASPVALPAPPPLQSVSIDSQPPTPPPPPRLPQLNLQPESMAPPLAAVTVPSLNLSMESTSFELETDPVAISAPVSPVSAPPSPRTNAIAKADTPAMKSSAPAPKPTRTTYSSGELDGQPRLLNRPSATFPSSLLRKGIKQGKVVLEVAISPTGKCTVRSIVSSSHPDFSAMARSFAGKARFSVPKKNGQPVTAIYRWPLILRP